MHALEEFFVFVENSGLLSKDVTHYVIPDPQVARDYLEIFEDPSVRGVIFTQTAVHSVSLSIVNVLKFLTLFHTFFGINFAFYIAVS